MSELVVLRGGWPETWKNGMARLSKREREVLELRAAGLSCREIEARLGIANGTLRTHQQSILTKLGVHSMTHAAVMATKAGIV